MACNKTGRYFTWIHSRVKWTCKNKVSLVLAGLLNKVKALVVRVCISGERSHARLINANAVCQEISRGIEVRMAPRAGLELGRCD